MGFKLEDKEILNLGCHSWFTLEILRWLPNSDLTGERYLGLLHRNQLTFKEVFSRYQAPREVIDGALNYIHASLIDLSKTPSKERQTSREHYDADTKSINDIVNEVEKYVFKPRDANL